MRSAVQVTARGGRCVLLGNPSSDVSLPVGLISQAMRREIDILGTWNSTYSPEPTDDDWKAVIGAMAAGTFSPRSLVTHRASLEDAPAMLAALRDRPFEFNKLLIVPHQP